MDPFQFYPTYRSLAERAWGKFRSHAYVRVLEPHAGNGDLALAMPYFKERFSKGATNIDCCEIDMSRHATLREARLNVVGMDFMSFSSGAIYSHCIMNPPFAEGAKHVLKAWDILWDAEISAIVNAETIRNPYTKERKRLVDLIEKYGEVEFIGKAFLEPEAERKADVEVAIVYLRKQATDSDDLVGDLFSQLKSDHEKGDRIGDEYQDFQQVALPKSVIENMVLTFDAAVMAAGDAIRARARANYYLNLIGETMEVRNAKGSNAPNRLDTTVSYIRHQLCEEYAQIKNRAWAGLLRSSNVKDRLSSKAQNKLESQFKEIQQLEFTASNIYGFLCGILEARGEIQTAMACDVFDEIVCYHSENSVFYRGWKSNDRHRACGIRIKTTRFVLPRHETSSMATGVAYATQLLLSDFDKVFAMLDCKLAPEFGVEQAFDKHFHELRNGARITTSYFDVRYFPKVGTIHFFPRDAALMDRLNRLVGRERAWLPPESARVNKDFWLQYETADKFDSELREEVAKLDRFAGSGKGALHDATGQNEASVKAASLIVDAALVTVLERRGIDTEFRLEAAQESLLLTA